MQTEYSNKDDVSTKASVGMKSGTILSDRVRMMYYSQHNQPLKPFDVAYLGVQKISAIIYPQIMQLENGSHVYIQDNFYTLVDQKGNRKFINRHSQQKGQILYFKAIKPNNTFYFICVQQCLKNVHQIKKIMLNISVTKIKDFETKNKQIFVEICNETEKYNYQLIDLIPIDSFDRCILSVKNKNLSPNHYQLIYVDLMKNNRTIQKIKNNNSLQSSQIQIQNQKIPQSQQVIQNYSQSIIAEITVNQYSKLINSQFGDIILLITPYDIKQIEIIQNQYLRPKTINIEKHLKTGQKIVEAAYIANGLRLLLITSYCRFLMVESQQLIFAQVINQIRNFPQESSSSFHQILTFTGGFILYQKGTKCCYLFKIYQNNVYFSHLINFSSIQGNIQKLTIVKNNSQLFVQYRPTKALNNIKIERIRIDSPKSYPQEYIDINLLKPSQKKVKFINMIPSSRTIVFGYENIIQGWRLKEQQKYFQKLFHSSFFQNPLNISIHPLGSHIILVFKQFIRFAYFQYFQIQSYYTLNFRNITFAKYTTLGDKAILAQSNNITVLNTYTFQTIFSINTYCLQMINVAYWGSDTVLVQQGNSSVFYFKGLHRLVDIKLQIGALSWFNESQLIIIRSNGTIQYYLHDDVKQQIDIQNLPKKIINNVFKFAIKEFPTFILPSLEFGFLFVGTNLGYIYEICWPIIDILNIQEYKIKVSSYPIIHLQLDAQYTKLYCINKYGNIQMLQIQQYINGDHMFSSYIFNHKTRGQQKQKRQITSRDYLIDKYSPYTLTLLNGLEENIQQLTFMSDKLKDDIQEDVLKVTQTNQNELRLQKNKINKQLISQQKQLEKVKIQFIEKIKNVKMQLLKQQKNYFDQIKQEIQKYQKELLQIYKQNDRLKSIKKSQNQLLSKQRNQFIFQHNKILLSQQNQKKQYYNELFDAYCDINNQYRIYKKQIDIENQQQKIQLQIYKKVIEKQVNEQLRLEQEKHQRLLGSNSILLKQIQNFNQRSLSFENILVQTKQQILQLKQDDNDYIQKKKFLEKELKNKEISIEQKEKQLQLYINNVKYMKKVKYTHEYQLNQYLNEIQPIQNKLTSIDQNVKKMNEDIMSSYNQKVANQQQINKALAKIQELKNKKTIITFEKIHYRTKIRRFVQELTKILQFQQQKKQCLQQMIIGLIEIFNQTQKQQKKQGMNLQRHKIMVRKQIEQAQKRNLMMMKNNNEILKYQSDGTTLVRQYNQLTKFHRDLKFKKKILQDKLKELKQTDLETPPKKLIHNQSERKISQIKLTPFQKYEQDLIPKQLTSETRSNRTNQSTIFLKSLIKDTKRSQSTYQKMQIVRQKVRNFVNPEMKLKKTIYMQKIILDRPRITSQSQQNQNSMQNNKKN